MAKGGDQPDSVTMFVGNIVLMDLTQKIMLNRILRLSTITMLQYSQWFISNIIL
jgi:hypothetical protein